MNLFGTLRIACLLTVTPLAAAQDKPEFLGQALKLQGESSWQALLDWAQAEKITDGNQKLASSFVAIAQAGLKDFSGAIDTLNTLRDEGTDVDGVVPGLGSPLVEVVNTLYTHCWANFDPTFNRQCWGGLFESFRNSRYSPVAASRLLMASLKENKSDEVKTYEDFFTERLESARGDNDTASVADLTTRYVDGYLLAGKSNAQIVTLAQSIWSDAWEQAARQHGFDGPVTGGDLSSDELAARRDCELDMDDAFNTLARATQLAGLELADDHPLFAMEAEPGITFSNCTEEVGLGDLKTSRVASGDFDNDGDPDLCFSGRLFLNNKGRFEDVTSERGLAHRGAGALFGDYDGDGNLDLLIGSQPAPRLYRNLGKRGRYSFEDVTTKSGLGALEFAATPEGLAWVDFDDDGDLDLYFALYEAPVGEGHADILLENRGDGTYADVSDATGVSASSVYCGRGLSPCDVDLDGDSELFVSNYRLNQNLLWSWDGQHLSDISHNMGVKGVREPEDGEYFGHTIGSVWGDVDGDGDLDIFSANLAHPRFIRQGFSNLSLLGIQGEDGSFTDEGLARGIRFQETHSDPALVDIDNDGDLDLSITCIYEGVPSALYQNDGTGHFTPITFRAGAAAFHAWGQAWLDFNGDGFLDVIYASSSGVVALRNSGNDNHYLRLDLQSKGKDPNAFGAIVRAELLESEIQRTLLRQLVNARGTSSQDEQIIHLGLGDYTGRVRVSVTCPTRITRRPRHRV